MKIILSRKGFDSKHGGMPSPILPDGTLLSLPTPCENGTKTYHELYHQDKSYFSIIKELNPKIASNLYSAKCHPDPDIIPALKPLPFGWKPAFGQMGPWESHLTSQNIDISDIFLFYGWFKQTTYQSDNTLRFIEEAPDLHIIFGYLQIGEIIKNPTIITKRYPWHPHAKSSYTSMVNNTLYLPSKNLSLNNIQPGCGVLPYHKKLVLTKEGHAKHEWNMPEFFKQQDVKISYHNNIHNGFLKGKDYFLSSYFGQEFVINGTFDLKDWAHQLIMDERVTEQRNHRYIRFVKEVVHVNHPDKSGNIYCRKRNKIIQYNEETCRLCKGLRHVLDNKGVECSWTDYSPEPTLMCLSIENPEEEYHRVNWLINRQLLPFHSELEECN